MQMFIQAVASIILLMWLGWWVALMPTTEELSGALSNVA